MAKIASIFGPIHGRVGSVVFRKRNGHTEVYALDDEAKRPKPTVNQKLSMAMLSMQSSYVSMHIKTINLAFSKGDCTSPRAAFLKVNYNGLKQALLGLCRDKVLSNRTVCPEDIEQAVQQYAQSHPHALIMALREGFEPVHITGAWPENIVLEPLDSNMESVSIRNVDGTTSEVVDAEILRQTLSRDWMTDEELAALNGTTSSTGGSTNGSTSGTTSGTTSGNTSQTGNTGNSGTSQGGGSYSGD